MIDRRLFLKGLMVSAASAGVPLSVAEVIAEEADAIVSGFSCTTNEHLIRSEIWAKQLQEIFLTEFTSAKFTRETPD